jgi:hypothetical protein
LRYVIIPLSPGSLRLVTVLLGVRLGCFGCMMRCMKMMSLRRVRVMRCGLVLVRVVVLGCLAMMARGVIVVLGRRVVMLRRLFRHGSSSQIFDLRERT